MKIAHYSLFNGYGLQVWWGKKQNRIAAAAWLIAPRNLDLVTVLIALVRLRDVVTRLMLLHFPDFFR
jgi:hypothetical protein